LKDEPAARGTTSFAPCLATDASHAVTIEPLLWFITVRFRPASRWRSRVGSTRSSFAGLHPPGSLLNEMRAY